MRTWNLSSLWRLPTASRLAWLKVVPPFFAHEGAVLERLLGPVMPPLIATDGPRVLLHEIPGEDQYDAPLERLLQMVPLLVGIQTAWTDRVGELLDLGLPDWRAPSLANLAEDALRRAAAELDDVAVTSVQALISGLPERFARVAGCGVPDSLVHGDFHPGNVRGHDRATGVA